VHAQSSPGLAFHRALVCSQFISTRPPKVGRRPRSSLHTVIAVAVFPTLGLFVNEEYLSNEPHLAPAVAHGTRGYEITTLLYQIELARPRRRGW
jgi:hypothetical protein